ncbi:MAG: hypothetical protein J6M62_09075 [Selenomonadaceae bacterium]|nr:hypothetical protein [Selenomonadaceae bacterium]MBP3722164.1 hypothetical protein [Selenomonadaceae bacterium]
MAKVNKKINAKRVTVKKRVIIKTSENSPEIAKKIEKVSAMLLERNKDAYERLSKMP